MAPLKPNEKTGVIKKAIQARMELIPNSAGVKYAVKSGKTRKLRKRFSRPPRLYMSVLLLSRAICCFIIVQFSFPAESYKELPHVQYQYRRTTGSKNIQMPGTNQGGPTPMKNIPSFIALKIVILYLPIIWSIGFFYFIWFISFLRFYCYFCHTIS